MSIMNSTLESFNSEIMYVNGMIQKYQKILEYFDYYSNGAQNEAKDLQNTIDGSFSYTRFANVLDGDSFKRVEFDITRAELSEYKKFYGELLYKMEQKLVSLYHNVPLGLY